MSGKGIWRDWASFEAQAEPIREQFAEVKKNPDLTKEAKARKRFELRQKFSGLHDSFVAKARNGLEAVEAEALRCLPESLESQAAARDPSSAIAARDLARGAAYTDLRTFVSDVRHRGSLARAHGLRQAITRTDDLSGEEKSELLEGLDSISASQREQSTAALVGFKVALSGLEGAGSIEPAPGVLLHPLKTITAFREAGRVPINQAGETRQLTEGETKRLLKLSGVPLHPPGGKALET